MTDYAANIRRNCIYQRAKGTPRDNGYPEGEHVRDCDICQGALEIERLTTEGVMLRARIRELEQKLCGRSHIGDWCECGWSRKRSPASGRRNND